jgi:hypothetical protein
MDKELITSWGTLYIGDKELGPLIKFMPFKSADKRDLVEVVYDGSPLPLDAPVDGYSAVLSGPLSHFGTVTLRLQAFGVLGDGRAEATFYWTPGEGTKQ